MAVGLEVLRRKAQAPNRRQAVVRSLKLASELATTKGHGRYVSGYAAYEVWVEELEDDARYEGKSPKDLFMPTLANGHTYYCLVDARASAAIYLRAIAGEFPPEARDHLIKAAELYEKECRDFLTKKCPTEVAPVPWFLKDGKTWTNELRHQQAAILRDALAVDRQAVAEIEKAVALLVAE